jgi:hypothetical protein
MMPAQRTGQKGKMAEKLWISEGCGLEWFISIAEAEAFAVQMKGTGVKLREFRTQHAIGRSAHWCIMPLIGTEPRGRVQVRCVPYETEVDGAFRVDRDIECFSIFASEAEARLAVAFYEFCRAEVPRCEALITAAGLRLDDRGGSDVRSFSRTIERGLLNIQLKRAPGGMDIGSLALRYFPPNAATHESIAKIQAKPVHSNRPFGLDVMAALSVAGARQTLGHMKTALEDGEEIAFIAELLDPAGSGDLPGTVPIGSEATAPH